MSIWGRKPMSQANMLRANGVEVKVNGKINPVGYYNPNKEKYVNLWTKYDYNQCVSRYVWEGLPNGLLSWKLERMLYLRQSLAGFKFADNIYILPYVMINGINVYGDPTKISPISFNGEAPGGKDTFFKEGFELPIDNYGNEDNEYGAVILYDDVPFNTGGVSIPRFALNKAIIEDIADTLARVNINVVVSNKKILLVVKDPKQADVVRDELQNAFASDCPFGVVTSPLETSGIQSTSDFNAEDLFNTIKNYDNMRCFMNGITSENFGNEKKERLVTGELAGNDEQKNLVIDMGLELRQDFCEKMNKKFGTNISVRRRYDDEEVETGKLNEEEQEGEEDENI